MPALAYGIGAYKREVAGLPEIRVVNMLAEQSPTGSPQPLLIDRPGLVLERTDAGGQTRLVWQRDGALGDKVLTVVGSRVLLDGVLVGTVPGDGLCRAAAGVGEVLLLSGGLLFHVKPTSVTSVAFPDGARVADLDFLRGRFVFVREGTGQFYWSDILDGDTIDGLSFATAESKADPLTAIRAIGDELWVLGTETVEPFTVSGDAELPYVPIGGRVFPKGCLSADTVVALDNTLFWVSQDRFVYRGGAAVPERVSTHGIEERIADVALDDLTAWGFTWRGHAFYVLRVEGVATLVFDVATGQWAEWKSYGRPTWDAWCGQNIDGEVHAGSALDGTLWRLSDDASTDEGEPIERLFTSLMPVGAGFVPVNSLEVACSVGRAPLGVAAFIETRLSRDGGFTWGPWEAESLGLQGNFRARPVWRRMGQADAPGYVFEHRVTDDAPFRVSGVTVNEAQRGRARG